MKEKNTSLNNMIYGIRKLSLVDYPSLPAFVIFLGGCNFRCPFCHNDQIVNTKSDLYTLSSIINMIKERKSFINAVVVTGGEPTIYGQRLIDLLKELRKFDLKIKLDTNGSKPILLKQIIDEKLVDYIAMDLKNTFEKYDMTAGTKVPLDKIKKSIRLIETCNIDYEFRITVNQTMHTKRDIKDVSSYIKRKDKFFIQPYQYNENQIVDYNYGEFDDKELEELKDLIDVKARI